jgi:hypothetical protein
MTDVQLYFAVGLPCFTILMSLGVQFVGFRDFRLEMRDLRQELREFRTEVRTALDVLTGKIGEMDTRLAVLEDRGAGK